MHKPPGLHVLESGQAYFGEVRLPFYVVDGALSFPVKESWLRGAYGDCVCVPVAELCALAGDDDPPG